MAGLSRGLEIGHLKRRRLKTFKPTETIGFQGLHDVGRAILFDSIPKTGLANQTRPDRILGRRSSWPDSQENSQRLPGRHLGFVGLFQLRAFSVEV